MPSLPRIVLVGGGNMGAALVAGWRERGVPGSHIRVVEPDTIRARSLADRYGVVIDAPALAPAGSLPADVVVLAVKPQVLPAVLADYAPLAAAGSLFLSIAAGVPMAVLTAGLGASVPVVRAMPNMPAQIRRGITVACANPHVTAAGRTLATELLTAVGKVAWVEDEAVLDPVTAVSGSGPAYVFLLAECLAGAGVDAGLPSPLADVLARETVAGAGALLAQSEETAEDLRRKVTSPGGTTAAALAVLEGAAGLRTLMRAAVAAATARAQELGQAAASAQAPGS